MTTTISWKALASVPVALAVPLAVGGVVYWWVTARTGDGLDALFPAFASIALVIAALWDGKALVPHPLRPRGLPVYAGSVDEVSQRLRGGSKVFFVLAAIALLAAVWLVYYFGG
jgi:hypothetical protein